MLVDTELELGVGDDDSLRQRMVGALDVGLQRALAQLVRPDRADELDDIVERDVLVVLPSSALVAGVNSGSANLLASDSPGGSTIPQTLPVV